MVEERLKKIEENLTEILSKLTIISSKLDEVEKDTAKNADIASLFIRYKPTIDKVENGFNSMLTQFNWLSFTKKVEQLELHSKDST